MYLLMPPTQKPETATFQQLLAPVAAEIVETSKLAEGRRTASFNHVKAVAEALQALAWLAYTGPETGGFRCVRVLLHVTGVFNEAHSIL